MPSVISAARGVGNMTTETSLVRDVVPSMYELDKEETKFATMLLKLPKKQVKSTKYEWFEDERLPRFDTLTAALTSAATSMTVSNPTYFRNNDLIKINDQEIVRVTATPTANPVSISRAAGTTAAKAASIGDEILLLGPAMADGSAIRDSLSTVKSPKHNFAQFMEEVYQITWVAQQVDNYTGNDLKIQRAKALAQLKQYFENCLWHGEKKEDTSGAQYRWLMGGILSFISTNRVPAGSDGATEAEFEAFARRCRRFGTRDKIGAGSPMAMNVINSYGREKLQTSPADGKYGFSITQYKSAGLNLNLMEVPHFANETNLTSTVGAAGHFAILDMGNLQLGHVGPSAFQYDDNAKTPGTNEIKGKVFGMPTLLLALEKTCGLMTDMTA